MLKWQERTDSLLIFITSRMGHNVSQIFSTELFWESLPWSHQRNKARRFERWEFPTFWRGARVPQGALWFNSGELNQLRYWKYPPVFFQCAVTWGLSQCHPNPCNCSWITSAQDCSAPGDQEMAVHLPACYILYRTVLSHLSSSSCANFPPLCPFSSWLLMGQQHFPVVLLAGHWVHKVLQSAAPGSSRNLLCSPPSSTTPELHPAFEHQRDQGPEAGC